MKKFDPKILPYMAAIAQSIQYTHSGYIYLSWVGAVTALFLGVLMSFVVAYASGKITKVAKDRRVPAWIILILLAVISPIFIGCAMWIALDTIAHPAWRILVAAVWGFIPDGSILLAGFIAGGSLVLPPDSSLKPVIKKVKPAYVCKVLVEGKLCGYEAKSQLALNGHMIKHRKRETT